MPHESFADHVGGMVAGGDEGGALQIAVYEDKQELVAVVRREWSHNVNRNRIPGALRLYGASRLLAVTVVGAQLTLGTALSGLQADVAAGLVCVPVTKEFPQLVATEVGGGMEFTGNPAGFVLIVQQSDLQKGVFWGRRIDGQTTEPIHIRLGFPGAVFHHEVVLFQCG